MHLSPRDLDKLLLHGAGVVAQKRLARGLRLNYPEAIALIATQILELIRDGKSVAELMQIGRTILGRAEVLEGVPEMIHEVQVEGTFADGTKLVTVHDPIVAAQGDLALALYGSFLPVPARARVLPASEAVIAGETLFETTDVMINEARETLEVAVVNTGDRPIQVGSHYPFWDTNQALHFDREAASNHRLDIPAGCAVRFEPGERKTVRLVELGNSRISWSGE